MTASKLRTEDASSEWKACRFGLLKNQKNSLTMSLHNLRNHHDGVTHRASSRAAQLACLLICGSVVQAFAVTAPKATSPKPPCCREGLPPGKYSERSLYQLGATWTSDVDRKIKLEALRGRPQVLLMFFTNCEHSCPLMVADMKTIDKALPRNVRGKVDFLLVSIDPERDTPEALRAFRAKHELPIERWTLLRGSLEATRELAERVGFNYSPGSPTQFAHSLLISVLNESGEIVFQQADVNRPPDDAVAALLRVTRAKRER
jgi:protein SCO1